MRLNKPKTALKVIQKAKPYTKKRTPTIPAKCWRMNAT